MSTIKIALIGVALSAVMNAHGQTDSGKAGLSSNNFSFSGYVEIYYIYDFNKPSDNNRPGFIYSHNRHNEFNLNLGFLKGSYNGEKVRANLALAAGTYMNANYSTEPGTLKNIYEASAGVKISRDKNLWLDVGIFASHIGFENAVSKDCPVLTRSILADNSPYYESGAKLIYTTNNTKWLISGLILNGWQRIKRVDDNSLISVGTQVQYKPNATTTFNYSTFIGSDKPDSTRQMRYFHNLYAIFNVNPKLGITAGFDVGTEQQAKGSSKFNHWYAPILIMKYAFNDKLTAAIRGEYYYDKKGVIISTATLNGFQTAGFSINVDYSPVNNVALRLETRTLKSRDAVFVKNNTVLKNNSFITSSIAISF